MKQQLKVWGSRTFAIALVVLIAHRYGPQGYKAYKRYVSPKKAVAFVPTAKVKKGVFTVTFHEMGTLRAERSVPVMSEINGKIISIIDEGTMVRTGDKLAVLDTSELEREARNQQLEYNNREADVDRANAELDILKKQNETELAQSQAELDFNKTELALARERLTRKQNLLKEKLVTLSEVEQAQLEVRSKELAVTKGEAALELKKKENDSKEAQKVSDVRNSQFRKEISKRQVEEADRRVKKAVITAPSSGMVVLDTDWSPEGRRKLQEGDQVRPQQTIISLPDLTSMLVKVNLGEADAPKISIGLSVLIRLEAVPNRVFHGTVKNIASLATEPLPWERTSSGGKSFDVTIAIKEVEPKTLKPGMTADSEFICETVKNALYVPIEAVTEREGKTYVFVKTAHGYNRTLVKVGTHNDNYICITKGLGPNQVVALRDPTKPLEQQESGNIPGSEEEGSKKDKGKQQAVPVPEAKTK